MITVGIDCSALDARFKEHAQRGIGRYVRALTTHLHRMALPDLTVRPFDHRDFALPPPVDRMIDLLPAGKQTVRQQVCYPLQLGALARDLDVIHFPAHMDAPSWSSRSIVVTVLDLIPLVCADLYRAAQPTWRYRLARWLENRAIRSAALILAISENTARDVHRLLGVPRDRIVVTPLGIDEHFFDSPENFDGDALRARYGIPAGPIVLYVGGIDPRKNYRGLLATFAELRSRFVHEGRTPPVLVMAGRIDRDREYPNLLEVIRRHALEAAVVLPGFVPDGDLTALYREAAVFFFPSLYEGFGLTPLEAMAAGVPVVSSNTSAMPEVVGDAALLVAPDDPRGGADALYAVITNPELKGRLAEVGPRQARRFTWARTAELTVDAYRRAAKDAATQPRRAYHPTHRTGETA